MLLALEDKSMELQEAFSFITLALLLSVLASALFIVVARRLGTLVIGNVGCGAPREKGIDSR